MSEALGWIGAGRMGAAMLRRLLGAGTHVLVWNRTATRAEMLGAEGAEVAADIAEAAARPLLFTSLAASADLESIAARIVALETRPGVVVDTSTVSVEASQRVRNLFHQHGIAFLSAPVSGNPAAVAAGNASFVCSGDSAAFDMARPALETIGARATLLGQGDEARIVKIAHNLLLAILTQGLAEVVTLCAARGVATGPLMEFLNSSVMGSTFTRYKTPAIVAEDLAPTFTSRLMLKDLDLGLAEGSATATPLPVTSLTRSQLVAAIAQGHSDDDFLSLMAVQARAAGRTYPNSSAFSTALQRRDA